MAEKQVALVTGGAKGIGLAIAKRLANENFQVVINAHHEPSAEQTKKWQDDGFSFDILLGDVANDEDAKSLVDQIIEKYGTIDVLVNNAGHG